MGLQVCIITSHLIKQYCCFTLFIWLMVLGFELRACCLLGKFSKTPSAHFRFRLFSDKNPMFLFDCFCQMPASNYDPPASTFPHSWDYRWVPPCQVKLVFLKVSFIAAIEGLSRKMHIVDSRWIRNESFFCKWGLIRSENKLCRVFPGRPILEKCAEMEEL
jgi:hypothetical protein